MSLILEALKKSERQRQVGTAPTLATPAMTRRARRSPLPWLITAIVIAGVVGWWMSRDASENPPTPQADEIVASGDNAKSAPAPEVPMTTLPPPAPIAAAPTVVAPPPAAAAPANTEKKIVDAPVVVSDAAAPAPAVLPRTSPTPTGPITTTPTPAPPPAAAPAATTPAAAVALSPSAGLPLIWELPYSKRKDLPNLTMSLQVYSDDPASRFAIINDERRKEGDNLADGLLLREITPEGLILEFQEERFLYPRGGR